uniref:Integrase catalytic domain-containing protein n=1 Tax=Cannabis sativa TaxID=3483 RepID=A0A803QRB4_CANSA
MFGSMSNVKGMLRFCVHHQWIILMSSPWPFTVWGIDLVGCLPNGKGGVKYAIVTIGYFTKWVEAKPMNTVTSKKALNFVIKNIDAASDFCRRLSKTMGSSLIVITSLISAINMKL